jgi:hypothetical protein
MTTRSLYRFAYNLDRLNRARKNPARFARNRAKSKALSALGFWSLMRRFWRA